MFKQLSRVLTRRLTHDTETHRAAYEFKERVARLFAEKYPGIESPRFSIRYRDGVLFVRGEQRVHASELIRERENLSDIAREVSKAFRRVVIS